MDKKTHVKALSNAGYAYPAGLGGLNALVDELVKILQNKKWNKGHVNKKNSIRTWTFTDFSGIVIAVSSRQS